MIDCLFKLNADGLWQCSNCGWILNLRRPTFLCRKPPRRNCPPKKKPLTPEQKAKAAKQQAEINEAGESLGWSEDTSSTHAAMLARWIDAGRPLRDEEEIEFILHALCPGCKKYRDGKCTCGGCQSKQSLPIAKIVILGTVGCPGLKW